MPTVHEKKSFRYVKETCPTLDEIVHDLLEEVNDYIDYDARDDLIPMFSGAAEKIKDKCTKPLREALVEVIEERDILGDELRDLQEVIYK